MTTILCIEDEADFRLNIVEALEDAGFAALEAVDGAEGLTAVRLHRPDLVLCDMAMPVMNGQQFLTNLRREAEAEVSATPTVFLSALGDTEIVSSVTALGADGYLVKPISVPELLAVVAELLGLRRGS